jgi:HEPN domain-containing protein
MPERERITQVVREWVTKAENDLTTAAHTLQIGEECPTDTVCFHAQQCVEKYIKAFLVSAGIDFPKTHDIGELRALMPRNSQPALSIEQERSLTEYATATRYPGDYEEITLSEARRAVSLARKVRVHIRKFLPKDALQTRKR